MNIRWRGPLGLLFCAALILCSSRESEAELVDRIAAVVNTEILTQHEVERAAAPKLTAIQGLSPELRVQERTRVLRATLDELIGQRLLMHEAEKLQVTAKTQEIDDYVSRIMAQYGWTKEQMEEALRREGSSMAEFRKDVRIRLSTSRLVQMKLGQSIQVSDADVDEALEREYAGLAREVELSARHILLLVPEGASEDDERGIRDRARKVLELCRATDADFGALAREHSGGPSASKGGEIGSFTRGMLDPAFEKAAYAAEVGEIVGPVRSRYGYHVIQVTRRRELAPKGEEVLRREVSARLRDQRLERAMKRWIEELRRKAYVDVKI